MRANVIVALALTASPAFAQDLGMYIGVGAGNFDFEEDEANPELGTLSDTVSSWKLYGGVEFNEHIALEFSYGSTSEIQQSVSGTDPFLGDFSLVTNLDFTTTTVKAVGLLPFDWGVLLGGIGYFDTDADVDANLTAACCGTISGSDSIGDSNAMAMLGVEWRFDRGFGAGIDLRLEYEWWDIEDADASTLGIGVAYRF
jgi:hypothetical protein